MRLALGTVVYFALSGLLWYWKPRGDLWLIGSLVLGRRIYALLSVGYHSRSWASGLRRAPIRYFRPESVKRVATNSAQPCATRCRGRMTRYALVRGAVAAILILLACGAGVAADTFPFDRELLLDAAPMRPGKRMPVLPSNRMAARGSICGAERCRRKWKFPMVRSRSRPARFLKICPRCKVPDNARPNGSRPMRNFWRR